MFEVDDELVWMGHDGANWLHGGIYRVIGVQSYSLLMTTQHNNPMSYPKYMNDSAWQLYRKYKKVKLPAPKNDIEWLDRVQQNFKE